MRDFTKNIQPMQEYNASRRLDACPINMEKIYFRLIERPYFLGHRAEIYSGLNSWRIMQLNSQGVCRKIGEYGRQL